MTIITDYTLDASAKTITLGSACYGLKIEEILSIFNLTKGAGIYDYREPRKRRAPLNEAGIDISITDGVITYIETAGMEDTDKLQIIISDTFFSNTPIITTSLVFAADDVLTTEKKTAALTIPYFPPSGNFNIAFSKPNEATAGDLTVNIYNQEKIDGTNIVDTFLLSLTVEQMAGITTSKSYSVRDLGIGQGTIKLGMKFAADSGAITVYAAVYAV